MAESTSVDEFIVGQSAATKELRRLVDILAPADSTVLIQGQTGSGKDVVARAIHALSGRSCLGMKKAHLQVQKRTARDALNWLMKVHYSWMKLAT